MQKEILYKKLGSLDLPNRRLQVRIFCRQKFGNCYYENMDSDAAAKTTKTTKVMNNMRSATHIVYYICLWDDIVAFSSALSCYFEHYRFYSLLCSKCRFFTRIDLVLVNLTCFRILYVST